MLAVLCNVAQALVYGYLRGQLEQELQLAEESRDSAIQARLLNPQDIDALFMPVQVKDLLEIIVEPEVPHRVVPALGLLFRYLLTVKNWFSRPDLYKYEFSTIAWRAMASAVHNERQKQSRRIQTISLDDPIPGTDGLTWGDIITEDNQNYSIYARGVC